MTEETLPCTKCGRDLPDDYFYRSAGNRSRRGRHYYCVDCHSSYGATHYQTVLNRTRRRPRVQIFAVGE